jgi:hypothetical protein
MKPASLLRWYPRAWRERYGEEMLALIQDDLEEGRPTWRLQLSVTWGGLRERGRRTRHAALAPFRHPGWLEKSGSLFVTGLVCAALPEALKAWPPAGRAWQAVALDALLAAIALTGAVVLADGLAALPALVRFLRAGGGAKIWRRARWAAGATAAAGGGLAALVLVTDAGSATQLDASWAYWAGVLMTGLATAVAIGLWSATATAAARYLALAPGVRATQVVLGAVLPAARSAVVVTLAFWLGATQGSVTLFVIGIVNLAVTSVLEPGRIGRAVRRGRRLRAGGHVATGRATRDPRHAR